MIHPQMRRALFLLPLTLILASATLGVAEARADGPTGVAPSRQVGFEVAFEVALPQAAPHIDDARAARPLVDFTQEDVDRAHFSGGRLAVEILAGAVGGGLASYGTLKAICGREVCVGGAVAALGVSILAAPTITYGVGRLMGGRGTYLSSVLGAGFAFVASAPLTGVSPGLSAGVGLALIPITAPLMYEVNSNNRSHEMQGELNIRNVALAIVPVRGADGRAGNGLGFVGTF